MKDINPELLKPLEEIMRTSLEQVPIPHEKGNSIRIKNIVVRRNKNGYHIFDLRTKDHLGYTHNKSTALAVAHCTAVNRAKSVSEIWTLENKMSKYYNDALFYKNTIDKTEDDIRRESAQIRFDIAIEECWRIKGEIENYIFDK